mmetsp:Transcript_36301/g.115524  ORF Transcript_36301/g.115524 Transcript_36301/m.115524 type:complete len:83 (-) Transcript_36301:548-796(-)
MSMQSSRIRPLGEGGLLAAAEQPRSKPPVLPLGAKAGLHDHRSGRPGLERHRESPALPKAPLAAQGEATATEAAMGPGVSLC